MRAFAELVGGITIAAIFAWGLIAYARAWDRKIENPSSNNGEKKNVH